MDLHFSSDDTYVCASLMCQQFTPQNAQLKWLDDNETHKTEDKPTETCSKNLKIAEQSNDAGSQLNGRKVGRAGLMEKEVWMHV